MSAEPFPVEPLNRVFAALADPTRRTSWLASLSATPR